MTTNNFNPWKPLCFIFLALCVAYLHINKENPEHRGVSLYHDASCTSTLTNTEPLIRLSDYEALQAEYRMLESELATVKKVAYGNVDLLDECERLRKNAERYHRLRTGDIDDIAVVRGLGAMDYGMSAVIGTYSEEIDGDVLDEVIDTAINSNHENQ